MPTDPGRAQRRPLRPCPPGPRRAELPGTLLDPAADAGPSRPTVREAFTLVPLSVPACRPPAGPTPAPGPAVPREVQNRAGVVAVHRVTSPA